MKDKYMDSAMRVYAQVKHIDTLIEKLTKIGASIVDSNASEISLTLLVSAIAESQTLESNGFFHQRKGILVDSEGYDTKGNYVAKESMSKTESTSFDEKISDRSALLIVDVLITEYKGRRDKLVARIDRLVRA